jgi:hypothetical protein
MYFFCLFFALVVVLLVDRSLVPLHCENFSFALLFMVLIEQIS